LWGRYVETKADYWAPSTHASVTNVFDRHVLPLIGEVDARELVPSTVIKMLGKLGREQCSWSIVTKARTYTKSTLAFACQEGLIARNPLQGIRLRLPSGLRKECGDFLVLEEAKKLLAAATGRDLLILQIFIELGLRPGELYALKADDIRPGKLRIDEAVKQRFRGSKRIGAPKTQESDNFVYLSPEIEQSIRQWIAARTSERRIVDLPDAESDFLFPTSRGTPFHPNNYMDDFLRPLAKRAGLKHLTHTMLRRTCATLLVQFANPKEVQRQLRHKSPLMTLRYMQAAPASMQGAVSALHAAINGPAEAAEPLNEDARRAWCDYMATPAPPMAAYA
jgi:integrase